LTHGSRMDRLKRSTWHLRSPAQAPLTDDTFDPGTDVAVLYAARTLNRSLQAGDMSRAPARTPVPIGTRPAPIRS
jgi:hypothetical protein